MATVTQLTSVSSAGGSVETPYVSVNAGDYVVACWSVYGTLYGQTQMRLVDQYYGTPYSYYGLGEFWRYFTRNNPIVDGTFYGLGRYLGFDSNYYGRILVRPYFGDIHACVFWRIQPEPGKMIIPVYSDVVFDTSTTPGITIWGGGSFLKQDDVVICCAAIADDYAITDTDTTGGTWSSLFYRDSTLSTDLAISSQYKIITTPAEIQYNGTIPLSRKWVSGAMVFREIDIPYWGTRTI